MKPYHVETVISEDGELTLQGIPFQVGDIVEIILLKRPVPSSVKYPYTLQNTEPYRYDDPFEPATALEDWNSL
jgi:hypothetical protein